MDLHPVKVLDLQPDRPVRFAIKCFGSDAEGPCGRVRVFTYLEPLDAIPDLSEVPPLEPSYPFIQEMVSYGKRSPRGRIGHFLSSACDLHLLGRLESDPQSKEAAYAGAAIYLRKATELLVFRFIFHVPVKPGKRTPEGLRKLATKLSICAPPKGLRVGVQQKPLSRRLLYIIDVGDVAAHPEVTQEELHKRRYRRSANDETIRKAFAHFAVIISKVAWQ